MRQVIYGSTRGLSDARAFVRRLGGYGRSLAPEPFVARRDIVVTRAPGRLSLFGGVADHAGAPALHLPLRDGVFVALQRVPERHVSMIRLRTDGTTLDTSVELPLGHLEAGREPVSYDVARGYFARHDDRAWAAGVAGALLVLMRERGVRFGEGFRILVAPALPARRGLGTGAAISVAVVRAICAEANLPVDAPELVALCQDIGHLVVGADPTTADHATAVRAESGHLLASVPPPTAAHRLVPWPADLGLWGLDDGSAHAPHDRAFGAARVGVAMAFRLVAAAAGLPVERQGPGRVTIDDARWRGRLANVPVDLFEDEFAPRLPERMTGADFLSRFDGVADPRAVVDPHTPYPVRAAARLAVHERERAIEFESFLGMYPSPDRAAYLGELLRASHQDHVACGLVTADTQAVVDLVSRRGGAVGLVGAKVTSGGGGGAVAVLGEADARPGLDLVRRQLRSRHHALPAVHVGSSPGAMRFGYLRLRGG